VEAKYVVTFKPGKEMEERVKELEERDAREAALKNQKPSHASAPTPQNTGTKLPEPADESREESPATPQLPNPQPSTQFTS
jgi:hypothetical protein